MHKTTAINKTRKKPPEVEFRWNNVAGNYLIATLAQTAHASHLGNDSALQKNRTAWKLP